MKHLSTISITFLLLFSLPTIAQTQTLLNLQAIDTLGAPATFYQYVKAVPVPATGGIAVLFDLILSGLNETDYGVTMSDSNGATIGAADFSTMYSGISLGTSIYSRGRSIYVVGFTASDSGNAISFNTMKIDALTFDTIWTRSENIDSGVQEAPVTVIADCSGNVYVGGSVLKASGVDELVVVKYDSSGVRQWVSSYTDTSGLGTTAVAMSIPPGPSSPCGTSVVVTGFSFDSIGHSAFVTIDFAASTGSISSYAISSGGTGAISRPVDIANDINRNSYIAGTSTVAGTASVIKVVAYDPSFSQSWMRTWGDSTLTTVAAGMALDLPGQSRNIYVTGSAIDATGHHSLVLLRYTLDGTLQWSRTITADDPAWPTDGISVTIDDLGNVLVAGSQYNGTDTTVLVAGYDTTGAVLFMRNYNRGSTNDVPYSIVNFGYPTFGVTMRSTGSDTVYQILLYNEYQKVNTLTTTTSGGQCEANQLIIRFDPSAVNHDAVDKVGVDFGPPSYWLTHEADSALQTKVPFDLSTCTMERIYKGLKTTYKYSIARNGDSVRIPDLWAGFLLIHPALVDESESALGGYISSLFPMVVHTGLNYVGKMMGCNNTDPHPVSCRVNDPLFFPGTSGGIYHGQQNLWNDSTSFYYTTTCDNNYNINIDSAWQLETGQNYIKVGIYDGGLDGQNEDFCPKASPDGNPGGKATGWDFYNNVSLPSTNWLNADAINFAHGTMIAGIIGAIRNNGRGIAGIAGGSYKTTADVGVSLYGMKIQHDTAIAGISGGPSSPFYGLLTLPVTDLCNALTVGTIFVIPPPYGTGAPYGFGLHVINCSWGVQYDSAGFNNLHDGVAYNAPHLRELELAFKNVYRNQVSIVAAAGNSKTEVIYPANFYGDWITCVGGADDTGARYQYVGLPTPSYSASFAGPCVDLIAPSISNPVSNSDYVINTTDYHRRNGQDLYPGYTNLFDTASGGGGTSMAAPHAVGTIALLMSYLDATVDAYQNLSPEDAEQLLVRSANNNGYIGHSDSTGWGDLNAGAALQSVNKGCKKLMHFGRSNITSSASTLVKQYTPLKLKEKYTNPTTGITFDTLPFPNDTVRYLCNVYQAVAGITTTVDSGFVVEQSWARPSSTTLMLVYDSVSHTLQPFEHLYIDRIGTTTAGISGYFYILMSPRDSSFIGFLGAPDSSVFSNSDSLQALGFEYTLLLNNTLVNCHPIDSSTTRIKEIENNIQASLHPNPIDDAGLLQIFTDANMNASINIFDMEGRAIGLVYSGILNSGVTTFNIDTKTLTSGLYFLVISSREGNRTIKFTKL